MTATGGKRVPVARGDRATVAAGATPRVPDPPEKVAAEDVRRLADSDAADSYRMLPHPWNVIGRSPTRLDRATFALRANSARFERGEISAEVWNNNVRAIIERCFT